MKKTFSFLRYQDGTGWNVPMICLLICMVLYIGCCGVLVVLDVKAYKGGKEPIPALPYFNQNVNPDTP